MKKFILSVAILASGMSTFAITNNVTPVTTVSIIANQEFTEISVDELPAAVTNAVKKYFTTATISKAYVNANGQYKLELTADNASNTVYADKDGNWLEESAIK
ncbi:hypothetical protein FHR24_001945 [Wenyingzhuangia heitensis]|uniref:Beta-lactamase-inhibitor-like, PepSY-like n=1 Tax=Wenyingzhuangia heitensis TaxID=1487859 RepID=A0ABX0U9I2_9FLAO|nr:hypothetical protein [Wenyingzhuangia heitensis]NIJ45477.1 hypothetical protein [Wenyingzhuangia heitensis]